MTKTRIRPRLTALFAALLMVTSAQAASKKELAAERYRYASTLLEDLESVPKLELDLKQYQLVIDAFRRVHRTTPASGYCDDALYSVAKIYGSMIDRFEDDSYRERAIEAYRFMARQYPHSKWREQALATATKLENGDPADPRPGPRLADPAPAAIDEPAVILTSRTTPAAASRYKRRTVIKPPNGLAKNAGPASIIDIRHHSENGATRIVLTLDNQIQLKYDRLERPDRLYFDLLDARVSNDFIGGVTVDVNNELVKSARLAQNRSNKARLVLDLNRPVSMDLIWLDNPARLAIDIRDPSAPPVRRAESTTPEPTPPAAVAVEPVAKVVAASYTQPELETPKPADTTSGGKHNLIRALGLKMSRIVIDAGHGGHDTGSIGRGGLREKDVALDIAHRLGDLLEERLGADVIYTRTTDEFISLNERPRIANSEEADLFISIHCNSVRNRTARGVETYYLNFTTDSWALNVASRENAASSHSIHELQDLVSKIALKEKIEESKEFATKIQAKLHSGLSKHSESVPDRGVRKAPFVVLIGAKMPAVLAEIGFISNKSDEALMKTDGYRAGVAEYLFDGIASYAGSLGTLSMKTPEKGTATAARLD